ncbi:hypothetical protein CYMTET_9536, partial [Cymbomonas tetramitiformis]
EEPEQRHAQSEIFSLTGGFSPEDPEEQLLAELALRGFENREVQGEATEGVGPLRKYVHDMLMRRTLVFGSRPDREGSLCGSLSPADELQRECADTEGISSLVSDDPPSVAEENPDPPTPRRTPRRPPEKRQSICMVLPPPLPPPSPTAVADTDGEDDLAEASQEAAQEKQASSEESASAEDMKDRRLRELQERKRAKLHQASVSGESELQQVLARRRNSESRASSDDSAAKLVETHLSPLLRGPQDDAAAGEPQAGDAGNSSPFENSTPEAESGAAPGLWKTPPPKAPRKVTVKDVLALENMLPSEGMKMKCNSHHLEMCNECQMDLRLVNQTFSLQRSAGTEVLSKEVIAMLTSVSWRRLSALENKEDFQPDHVNEVLREASQHPIISLPAFVYIISALCYACMYDLRYRAMVVPYLEITCNTIMQQLEKLQAKAALQHEALEAQGTSPSPQSEPRARRFSFASTPQSSPIGSSKAWTTLEGMCSMCEKHTRTCCIECGQDFRLVQSMYQLQSLITSHRTPQKGLLTMVTAHFKQVDTADPLPLHEQQPLSVTTLLEDDEDSKLQLPEFIAAFAALSYSAAVRRELRLELVVLLSRLCEEVFQVICGKVKLSNLSTERGQNPLSTGQTPLPGLEKPRSRQRRATTAHAPSAELSTPVRQLAPSYGGTSETQGTLKAHRASMSSFHTPSPENKIISPSQRRPSFQLGTALAELESPSAQPPANTPRLRSTSASSATSAAFSAAGLAPAATPPSSRVAPAATPPSNRGGAETPTSDGAVKHKLFTPSEEDRKVQSVRMFGQQISIGVKKSARAKWKSAAAKTKVDTQQENGQSAREPGTRKSMFGSFTSTMTSSGRSWMRKKSEGPNPPISQPEPQTPMVTRLKHSLMGTNKPSKEDAEMLSDMKSTLTPGPQPPQLSQSQFS